MQHNGHRNPGDGVDHESLLQGLLIEAGGEASIHPQMTVLSCGGIFVPRRRKISIELKNWRQIVNIPGRELSAKIFGFEAQEEQDPSQTISPELQTVFRKEILN